MISYYLSLFIRYLKLERAYSDHTIAAYQRDLHVFNCQVPIQNIKIVINQFNHLLNSHTYAIRTIRRKKYALKSFLNFLILQDLISEQVLNRFAVPKLNTSLPLLLKKTDIQALFAALDINQKTYIRDKALLEMLYGAGLRVSELCELFVSNVFLTRSVCRICAKGKHWRDVVLGELLVNNLQEYQHLRHQWLGAKRLDFFFIHPNGKPLTRQWVYVFLNKLAQKACLGFKISPHMLRHSYASHLLEGGASIKDVSTLLGHKELSSTQIYTHVSTTELKKRYFSCHPRS